MDAFWWIFVGSFIIHQVTTLSCFDCTHIVWNTTDLKSHIQQLDGKDVKTSWVAEVNNMLLDNKRFNPACPDAKYPVGFSKNKSMYTVEPTPMPFGTVATQKSQDDEWCQYLHVNVQVNATFYGKTIKLVVHVRNRVKSKSLLKGGKDCVEINPYEDSSHNQLRKDLKDRLSFLGKGTVVLSFDGSQCLCTSSSCPSQLSPTSSPTTSCPDPGTSEISTTTKVFIALFVVASCVCIGLCIWICVLKRNLKTARANKAPEIIPLAEKQQ